MKGKRNVYKLPNGIIFFCNALEEEVREALQKHSSPYALWLELNDKTNEQMFIMIDEIIEV